MIAKNPNERSAYDARVKFQRDESARLLYAREEGERIGEARGEARGEAIGKIRLLRQLLGETEPASDDLERMDLAALEALASTLQERLRERS